MFGGVNSWSEMVLASDIPLVYAEYSSVLIGKIFKKLDHDQVRCEK